ncbi:hypothetical protein FHX14_000669 [Rhizobium sp. BK619]|nr:hypothetical protein [Rhizobium sp. BK619]
MTTAAESVPLQLPTSWLGVGSSPSGPLHRDETSPQDRIGEPKAVRVRYSR